MVVRNAVAMPTSASARDNHGPLVSKFWPEVISLPMEIISARMGTPFVESAGETAPAGWANLADRAPGAILSPDRSPVLYSS